MDLKFETLRTHVIFYSGAICACHVRLIRTLDETGKLDESELLDIANTMKSIYRDMLKSAEMDPVEMERIMSGSNALD